MSPLQLNLSVLVMSGTYLASLVYFDRLLRVEAQLYPEHWEQDGCPVGIYGLAKGFGGRVGPREALAAMLRFYLLYFLWLFRTPCWISSSLAAKRCLWVARSLFWLFGVEVILCKELM
jgi:hypothetical protein